MLQAGESTPFANYCLFSDRSENHVTQVGGMHICVSVCKGGSSVGAVSGLSGETEERIRVIKRCEEKAMEVAESRRGYVYGAAWDEGNMIQAMARLKNPRYRVCFVDTLILSRAVQGLLSSLIKYYHTTIPCMDVSV